MTEHYLAAHVLAPWGWAVRCACEWHSTGARSTEEAAQLFEAHLAEVD